MSPETEGAVNISFLGAGRWGCALAMLLVRKGHTVRMWEYDAQRLSRLLSSRAVPDLPEDARIPDSVALTSDLGQVVPDAELLVLALPTQSLRDSLDSVRTRLSGDPVLVSVMKGLEVGTHWRVSEIVKHLLPDRPVAVLTGPGIPYDVVAGDPTSLVVAADEAVAQLVRDNFAVDNLRVYSTTDVVGAELGGALKNVIAIAAGIIDGLGLGINAQAALLTRGLAEMTRLGLAQGANPMTFAGLSGVGDLIVTAFSPRSRNHRFGQAIAQGTSIPDALAAFAGVAEGYYTCRAAYELAAHVRVELPIINELYRILYQTARPQDSIRRLLSRSLKSETWN